MYNLINMFHFISRVFLFLSPINSIQIWPPNGKSWCSPWFQHLVQLLRVLATCYQVNENTYLIILKKAFFWRAKYFYIYLPSRIADIQHYWVQFYLYFILHIFTIYSIIFYELKQFSATTDSPRRSSSWLISHWRRLFVQWVTLTDIDPRPLLPREEGHQTSSPRRKWLLNTQTAIHEESWLILWFLKRILQPRLVLDSPLVLLTPRRWDYRHAHHAQLRDASCTK